MKKMALVLLCLSVLSAPAYSDETGAPTEEKIKQEALSQQKAGIAVPLATTREVQDVCAGSVPAGWIKVNDHWNPTICGNPTNFTYNVWTIERYDNKPKGSAMNACSGAVPSGWSKIGDNWDPTACGHPSNITKNIMTIKRLN